MSALNVLGSSESSSVKGFAVPDFSAAAGLGPGTQQTKEPETLSSRTPPTKETSLVHQPLVVSPDSKSPEAVLSRNASTIEKQMAVDTKYDAIVERFESYNTSSRTLLQTSLLLVIVGALVYSLRA